MAGFDAGARLSRVRCPTLVVVGALNRRTHRQGRTLARWIPRARLAFLPGAGHLLHLENPAGFARLLMDFLRGVETQP